MGYVYVCAHFPPRDHNKPTYECIYDMSVYTYSMCMCTLPSETAVNYVCIHVFYVCICVCMCRR